MTVSKVGKVDISGGESSVLRMQPKFVVRDRIEDEECEFQEELGWAKLRFTLLKEEEEYLDSDDDEDDLQMTSEDDLKMTSEDDMKMTPEDDQIEEMQEMIEAKSRHYYDPEEKIYLIMVRTEQLI